MNHQIQHDVDIGPALTKGAQAVPFNKGGPFDVGAHTLHDWIESLAVSDLQKAGALRR